MKKLLKYWWYGFKCWSILFIALLICCAPFYGVLQVVSLCFGDISGSLYIKVPFFIVVFLLFPAFGGWIFRKYVVNALPQKVV